MSAPVKLRRVGSIGKRPVMSSWAATCGLTWGLIARGVRVSLRRTRGRPAAVEPT